MHVLIINQTFYPDIAATAQLMWDLAQSLSAGGNRVSVVTSRVAYGRKDRFAPFERVGRIEIHRGAQTSFATASTMGRACDFLSFYPTQLLKISSLGAPDAVVVLSSPPMVGMLGMLAKEFAAAGRKPRFVSYIMDLYPDAALAMGLLQEGSGPHRLLWRMTQRTLSVLDAIIVPGRGVMQRVVDVYGQHRSKINVVSSWADSRELTPLPKSDNPLATELGLADSFNVVYSGNLGLAHDVDTLIRAIEKMRNDAGVA